jgi:hypothetical protein
VVRLIETDLPGVQGQFHRHGHRINKGVEARHPRIRSSRGTVDAAEPDLTHAITRGGPDRGPDVMRELGVHQRDGWSNPVTLTDRATTTQYNSGKAISALARLPSEGVR